VLASVCPAPTFECSWWCCHATKLQGLACLLFLPLLALTLTIAALLVVSLAWVFLDEHLLAFLALSNHLLVRDEVGELIVCGSY